MTTLIMKDEEEAANSCSLRGGMLGYTAFQRTYAAPKTNSNSNSNSNTDNSNDNSNSNKNKRETFRDCVRRIMKSNLVSQHCQLDNNDKSLLYQMLLEQKCSLSGRYLKQLGTQDHDSSSSSSSSSSFLPLCSCAVTVVDDPIRPFCYAAHLSLLGVGVGYSVRQEHVGQLPRLAWPAVMPVRVDVVVGKDDLVDKNDQESVFVVQDSRLGWIELFEALLKAFYHHEHGRGHGHGTTTFQYSLEMLQESGSARDIAGLEAAVNNVAAVLSARAGQKPRPVDCMDVMNIMAPAVCQGMTRRAALLAIGDATDVDFLSCKRWDLNPNLPLWRSASNNSVACSDIAALPDEFWEGYRGNGEAMGLVNMDLIRFCGRAGETQYPDPDVCGVSACAEQGLAKEEVSCLAELMLPHFEGPDELWEATRLLYTVCKSTYTMETKQAQVEKNSVADDYPYPTGGPRNNLDRSDTAKIAHENFRMGIGITGYMQASEEQKSWLADNYARLREYDRVYSQQRGLPRSIKLTTVKPSGTVSLLSGSTPGCHPGFSRYFIRRIRFNKDDPLLEGCRAAGLKIEDELGFDGKPNQSGRQVVEFYCELSDTTQLAEDTSAIQQLEVIRRLQKEWSDSAVSVTVYYRLHELEEIQNWLAQHYTNEIKACSFLLHCDHGFLQAPYEKITKDEYDTARRECQKRAAAAAAATDELNDDDDVQSFSMWKLGDPDTTEATLEETTSSDDGNQILEIMTP